MNSRQSQIYSAVRSIIKSLTREALDPLCSTCRPYHVRAAEQPIDQLQAITGKTSSKPAAPPRSSTGIDPRPRSPRRHWVVYKPSAQPRAPSRRRSRCRRRHETLRVEAGRRVSGIGGGEIFLSIECHLPTGVTGAETMRKSRVR